MYSRGGFGGIRGGMGQGRGGASRRPGIGALLLFSRLYQMGLEHIPPVTLFLTALNAGIFYFGGSIPNSSISLWPRRVIVENECRLPSRA